MTINSKLNVYHPVVVAAMKKRGFVPVKQVEARKQWNDINKAIADLGAKVKRDAERTPGKRPLVLINVRAMDFGQTPHRQKPQSLFKGKK